jgi:hypothetical protein
MSNIIKLEKIVKNVEFLFSDKLNYLYLIRLELLNYGTNTSLTFNNLDNSLFLQKTSIIDTNTKYMYRIYTKQSLSFYKNLNKV